MLVLQETWLYPDDFSIVSRISEEYQSFSISSMSLDDNIIRGRPHGGMSVLWNKSLSNSIRTIQYDDNRILGIEVKSKDTILLFLSVYLPYECDMYYDDYCFYLSKLQCIIDTSNTPYVFILGDFNADIQSASIFGAELIDFCDNNELCFVDKERLLPDTFTYTSQAHGTTSWLDHCITTLSGQSIISHVSVIDNVVCSDHFPLCIEIFSDINPLCNSTVPSVVKSSIKWHAAKDLDKHKYNAKTGELTSTIALPVDALMCKNPHCTGHCDDIDCFYDSIISILKQSASYTIPMAITSNKYDIIPGWNEYVKEHHSHAKDALWWWKLHNRPRHGQIYDNMRIARAHFKYALRFVKKQEEMARADSLARDLSDKDVDGFWKTMRKMNNCNTIHANVIDGVTGPENIASHWKQHFDKLLNIYVNCDNSLKTDMLSKFDNIEHDSNMAVSTKSVSEIISKLECGKSAGPDGIDAEYLKFSNIKIHVLLSMCFTLCLTHGYIPPAMIETTIVPIVKNKSGNLSDSNNYRPIALATIVSKMLESVLLLKCVEYLSTSDNQFGFKSLHSTDLCIYTLKEFIEYYKTRGTTVYVTFLDASKAFDRIDHWLLFNKMFKKGVPLFIIKLLAFWYSRQRMFVRWGDTCSVSFCVTNGVKQGGIISPMLFNLYMDDLSLTLNCSGIGGYIGTTLINHLCYADDLCLISLSSSGMQQLLNICKEYASEHKLLYNGSKSFALCFKQNALKVSSPSFFLDQMKIPTVEQCRYLGITISVKNSDLDIKRQMRKMYANVNLLLRKFSKCSVGVKCFLFKTYCSSLYCAPMWFDCTKTALKRLKIAYNNSLRRFMFLPWRNSATEMFVNLGINSFDEMLRMYIFGFRSRVTTSYNQLLSSLCSAHCSVYSKLWAWWDSLLYIIM